MVDLSKRIYDDEWMDDLSRPQEEFDRAYKELTFLNRHLGGLRAVERFLRSDEGGLLLDVGAGGCDIGDALGEEGHWMSVSMDLNAKGLHMAAGSAPVIADAFEPPFRDESFDVVSASLLFHHLSNEDCVQVLANMYRIAKKRVIVNDLHRHPMAYYSILLLTRLFSESPMVQNDGPLSVRRGFKRSELYSIAQQAGISVEVYRSFPYRLVLVAEK